MRTADPSADGRRSAAIFATARRTAVGGGHIVSSLPGRYLVIIIVVIIVIKQRLTRHVSAVRRIAGAIVYFLRISLASFSVIFVGGAVSAFYNLDVKCLNAM